MRSQITILLTLAICLVASDPVITGQEFKRLTISNQELQGNPGFTRPGVNCKGVNLGSNGQSDTNISYEEPDEPDQHLVARWCFESGLTPLDDSSPAGLNNKLSVLGNIRFEDGIAKFPFRENGAGLKTSSGLQMPPGSAMTLWVRFKVSQAPSDTIWLLDKGFFTTRNRSLGIYLAPDRTVDYRMIVGTKFSDDGFRSKSFTEVDTSENPPAGLWIQVALVIDKQENLMNGRLYYRTEHTNMPNHWNLLGIYSNMGNIFRSDASLFIGNNPELKQLSSELWIDELRIYDCAFSIDELFNIWPVLGAYPEISGKVPGSVVDYLPSESGFYLGSPSIIIMPDGSYVAKADEFGRSAEGAITRVYRSLDNGKTWKMITRVDGMFWSNLFYHDGALYMMGTNMGHGSGQCIIRRSEDAGFTWTVPKDENSGILLPDIPYHTAPMPMVIHNGRIWRSMEDEKGKPYNHWGPRFRAFMMSAPLDSDLLKASSWTSSVRLNYNPEWLDGRFRGWLEGNAVVDPEGNIVNILRTDFRPEGGKAAIIMYSEDGKEAFFDPDKDFIDLPGGSKKFFIRYDEKSAHYWALSNAILPKHAGYVSEEAKDFIRINSAPRHNPGGRHSFSNPERLRNTIVLMISKDLREWDIVDIVLYHPDVSKHGFQYPHFVFDGDDIIFLSRTAYDDGRGGADNQHNANFITFHRIANFRKLAAH